MKNVDYRQWDITMPQCNQASRKRRHRIHPNVWQSLVRVHVVIIVVLRRKILDLSRKKSLFMLVLNCNVAPVGFAFYLKWQKTAFIWYRMIIDKNWQFYLMKPQTKFIWWCHRTDLHLAASQVQGWHICRCWIRGKVASSVGENDSEFSFSCIASGKRVSCFIELWGQGIRDGPLLV